MEHVFRRCVQTAQRIVLSLRLVMTSQSGIYSFRIHIWEAENVKLWEARRCLSKRRSYVFTDHIYINQTHRCRCWWEDWAERNRVFLGNMAPSSHCGSTLIDLPVRRQLTWWQTTRNIVLRHCCLLLSTSSSNTKCLLSHRGVKTRERQLPRCNQGNPKKCSTLLFFRSRLISSKLLHYKQTHQPVMVVV